MLARALSFLGVGHRRFTSSMKPRAGVACFRTLTPSFAASFSWSRRKNKFMMRMKSSTASGSPVRTPMRNHSTKEIPSCSTCTMMSSYQSITKRTYDSGKLWYLTANSIREWRVDW
eukprot:Lithocolla_globosa_v1_NODE_191_length_5320_cov_8.118139.p5 type:complete len:116 gc:universal NODE_191_length_5320_cov_8.118139:2398-2051(-)